MQTYTHINARLKLLVNHFTYGNAAAFAKSIHVVQQGFDRLLKPDKNTGRFPTVKPELVSKILNKYPDINGIWLLSGAGLMLHSMSQQELQDSPFAFMPATPSGIPCYRADFMHEFSLIQNKQADSISYYIDCKIFNHIDFWCLVGDSSMEPDIALGDIVAMQEIKDKKQKLSYGSIYGVVTKDFSTVRRISKGRGKDTLALIPANKSPEFPEQQIPRSSIQHLFHIPGCIKKL